MKWSDDLSVGVEKIDEQHKALFDAVDNLYEACKAGKGRQNLEEMLNFLQNYATTHFRDEEKIQAESVYPDFQRHKELHRQFVEEFLALRKKVDDEGVTIVAVSNVYSFVSNWLIRHIKLEDHKIGEFINKKA